MVDTEPHYPDYVYCVRRGGLWFEVVSGNGPTAGWDDPAAFTWS